jgi:hypothetical protein
MKHLGVEACVINLPRPMCSSSRIAATSVRMPVGAVSIKRSPTIRTGRHKDHTPCVATRGGHTSASPAVHDDGAVKTLGG